jgi:hypothetical protein
VVTRRGRGKTFCARGACPAWSSGPSTSPLEVTMYVRDPAALLVPSRRVNFLRLISNAWFGAFFGLMVLAGVLEVLRLNHVPPFPSSYQLLVYALFISAAVAVPLWYAFGGGFIKCPCCREPFARIVISPFIGAKCTNCGYDVARRTRQGDF